MSLIVYECQEHEWQHENRQFIRAVRSLYNYFSGREELAVFIGNINIGNNLDGLIIKNDAVIIVEFKDYSGSLMARQNGDWTCDHLSIHGGSNNKTVFRQLQTNKRAFISALKDRRLLREKYHFYVHVMVVLTRLDSVEYVDFERKNLKWITVTDVDKIGSDMAQIKMGRYTNERTGRSEQLSLSNDDIWKFLRQSRIDERALITDYSSTSLMPPDLFHPDRPHNGKNKSLEDQLVFVTEDSRKTAEKLKAAEESIDTLKSEYEAKINEVRADSSKAAAELTECKNNLTAAQEQINALTGENTRLQKQIAALKNAVVAAATAAKEKAAAEETVAGAAENLNTAQSGEQSGKQAGFNDMPGDGSGAAAVSAADQNNPSAAPVQSQAHAPEQNRAPAPEQARNSAPGQARQPGAENSEPQKTGKELQSQQSTVLPSQHTAELKNAAAASNANTTAAANTTVVAAAGANEAADFPAAQAKAAAAGTAGAAGAAEALQAPQMPSDPADPGEPGELHTMVQETPELKKPHEELQDAGGLYALLTKLKDAAEHMQHPRTFDTAGVESLRADKEQLTQALLQSQNNLIAAQRDTNALLRENIELKKQIVALQDTSQIAVLSQKLQEATQTIESLKVSYENKLNEVRDDRDRVVRDLIESKNTLIAVQNNASTLLQENMELKSRRPG